MEHTKQDRLLEIFFRLLRGESLSVQKIANEYKISTKSVSRDINDLKAFFADHRELMGNTELKYSNQSKAYHLYMDEFLTNRELFALIEIIIGARAFSKEELLTLTNKLKGFTTATDRPMLSDLIRKELYHYTEIKHECDSVQDTLWKLASCITEKKEITVDYYRADRALKTHRIRPASLMFTDYFVVNKMDDRRKEDGDTSQTLERVRAYLRKHGIINPNLFPAAALPALNIRLIQNGVEVDEDTLDETEMKVRKLNRNPSLHFEEFASLPASIRVPSAKVLGFSLDGHFLPGCDSFWPYVIPPVCCFYSTPLRRFTQIMQKSSAERHLHGVLATLSRCKATIQKFSSIMIMRTI